MSKLTILIRYEINQQAKLNSETLTLGPVCKKRSCLWMDRAQVGLSYEEKWTWPADILVNNWCINGKLAAFDLSVSSPLKTDIVPKAGHTYGYMTGSAAAATGQRRLLENSNICDELGWSCIPLVAESFGPRVN